MTLEGGGWQNALFNPITAGDHFPNSWSNQPPPSLIGLTNAL